MEENVIQVFTIGHSNHSAEKFIGLLNQHSIELLIDVRSKPSSRFCPHFNQTALRELLVANKIGYGYSGLSLGGRSNYSVTSPLFISQMEKALGQAAVKRVALMCSEGKPKECHRAGKLTAWLHRTHPAVQTVHILPDGTQVDAKAYEPQIIEAERNPGLTW
jgi:uncharacterized protein (DUF488 family)